MTQPRLKNVAPRMLRRLKRGSVPTLLLTLSRQRQKRIMRGWALADVGTSQKAAYCSGIPTYAQLVNSIPNNAEKVQSCKMPAETQETFQGALNSSGKCTLIYINGSTQELKMDPDATVEITELHETSDAIHVDEKPNEQLIRRIQELEAICKEKDKIIQDLKKDTEKRGRQIAVDILGKFFPPGQIKRLLNPPPIRTR